MSEVGRCTVTRLPDPFEQLQVVGMQADEDIDLAVAALLLAAVDRPEVGLEPYRRYLAELAEDAAAAADSGTSVAMQATALRAVLVDHHGYHGDEETYDDLRNANLLHVIDRRQGLPVALGILYLHAARAYGGRAVGLNFPSHFMIRLEARGQRAIIDPFHDGRVMSTQDLRQRLKMLTGSDAEIEPEHYAKVGNRDILIRLQNNIKLRAVRNGDLARALGVLQTMTAIAPMRTELWWETAVVHYRLGNVRTAITTLEDCLAGSGAPGDNSRIEDLLRQLRGSMH